MKRERTKARWGCREILALQQANKIQLDDAILRAPFDGLITRVCNIWGTWLPMDSRYSRCKISALRVRVAVASICKINPRDAEATLEYNDNEYSVFMSATPFTDPVTQTQDLLLLLIINKKT